jgi:hypothetical protein
MCGGVYEEDFNANQTDAPGTDNEVSKDEEQMYMESRKRRVMGDIKFMTAGDFMSEQDEYYTPGSDPQI